MAHERINCRDFFVVHLHNKQCTKNCFYMEAINYNNFGTGFGFCYIIEASVWDQYWLSSALIVMN